MVVYILQFLINNIMKPKEKLIVYGLVYMILIIFILSFFDNVIEVDKKLFLLINGVSNTILDKFFLVITSFGSMVFWLFVVLILWIKKQRKISITLLIALAIDLVFVIFLKWIFFRPRPSESLTNVRLLSVERRPSFPSAHAERSFLGASILSSYYNKWKIPFYFFVTLVALSRIYIGVHYPLDTLIGAINGIMLGQIILLFSEKIMKKLSFFRNL